MARIRKSLTFSPEIVARAEAVMLARGFDDWSEFTSALYREEYERRHTPTIGEPENFTPVPPSAPVSYAANETAAQAIANKLAPGLKAGLKAMREKPAPHAKPKP